MRITYDITKRNKTLIERGLNFADAKTVFAGHHFTAEDSRQDYGDPRGADRRIISMRKANEREQALYAHRLG